MRRSKSNPAKYAKNYRSISQRRMTEYDALDEDAEILRLKQVIQDGTVGDSRQTESLTKLSSPENERNQRVKNAKNPYAGVLSDELLEEAGVTDPSELLIMPGSKPKKPKQTQPQVVLTPLEIRQAKLQQKNAQRKLKQLEQRANQKQKRAELYSKLKETAIQSSQMELLESSSDFTKKKTKQEKLKRLIKRERAGIELTREERELLYVGRTSVSDTLCIHQALPNDGSDLQQSVSNGPSKKRKLANDIETACNSDKTTKKEDAKEETTVEPAGEAKDPIVDTKPQSFAAMMLASLSKVKEDSEKQNQLGEQEETKGKLEALAVDRPSSERYIAPTPTVVKTAAGLGMRSKKIKSQNHVIEITRPEAVQAARFDLPVSAMEYEVMDAIRNNDVTIICGETGSGKSTQIPQFVYSAGLTQTHEGQQQYLIGVTQPRRVAAVSTAKRVCYEMGQGDGQSIRSKGNSGNLVAYQTRYETAGIGCDCHVKFMTDGILLQEIQSDLLLRKYSVIVLDEAHERNLNTDVLIGLLSVALPLRKQAVAEEASNLVPLKLIIMSATLRVEDFTSNKKLFPLCQPAVVTIPGRTHPVTIHHSKVTELVDYEDEASRKVCKIHRKLPPGGILVFLTGRQEIIRMVNRLRRALCKADIISQAADIHISQNSDDAPTPRDMDDDELDGDLYGPTGDEDEGATELADLQPLIDKDADGNIPRKAYVLPLYSLLSADEQAKIFAPVPDGHRLIVVSTNIAETSLTIPGISYVVDTGRQKCRNFNVQTGVSSFDISWISKAAANQRAGRAGRTSAGHCYRLYSSSMFTRHMKNFAQPEVLIRPLEDVVLAMKAMKISNVSCFPFPTPPAKNQLLSATQLLANIGCLVPSVDPGSDGEITRLGSAVAQLPLGVRYGKILLVGAQAGVLDYIIPVVAVLSEVSPFKTSGDRSVTTDEKDGDNDDSVLGSDDSEKHEAKTIPKKWFVKGGDVLAAVLALGGYTYAGRGAGGASEKAACEKFCEDNGLNPTVMFRIQKMRIHLARLAGHRLRDASGIAAKTGGIVSSMPPPDKLQERLLCQAIASGLLDNVAMLAPPGSIPGDHPYSLRSAYVSCTLSTREPLFMDRNSVLYSRDSRQLPQWVCYDSLLQKTHKDGTSFAVMKDITPIDPSWLGRIATGSALLRLGEPKPIPPPLYDADKDAILCHVSTIFGRHGWEIPPLQVDMYNALQKLPGKQSAHFAMDDSFRWFARFLLEGKVLVELADLPGMLNDTPSLLTRKATTKKAVFLVSALSSAGVDTAAALQKHWAEVDDKFLFKHLRPWIKAEYVEDAKRLWISTVKRKVAEWRSNKN
ncbi:hypothetical protein MPSEU_000603800 [Mayamaea pseudoterrestris]|nr:hypothetical protein MPSEU_000603800 [Mayamaea pseudoterrestris]